jgi:putative nucleotidyltransferase with HDIG domain
MKKKILIVEDERIIAEDIRKCVLNCDYDVIGIVPTGQDTLLKIEEQKPDLILMDIMLEGKLDGIETAEKIISKHDIPVIYITANADDTILARAKKTNPYGYLVKPFEEIDLNAALEIAFYKYNADKELTRSEKRFRKLIQENTDVIIVIDKKRIIQFINNAGEMLFEKSKEQLINTKFEYKFDCEQFCEFEIEKKSEQKRIIEMHVVETEWEHKPVYLATLRDITFRKKIQDELKMSNIKLQKLMEETVNGLVSAMEMRDPYTAGHQKRVAELATKIAEEMGLDKDHVNGIRIASLIHDIGKIHVPSEILSKPGKLTEVEFAIVKSHSKAGYEILRTIEFPWPVAKTVLQHHEKLDGSSYPNGLTGDDIIIEAKILCVADVIEAMSTHRPYRPALSIEKALEEIIKNKSIKYDASAVDACVKIIREQNFCFA